jgi:hypothetical protein
MIALRLASAFGILGVSAIAALAEPAQGLTPIKPPVVVEQKFDLPFQFKTEAEMKFRGPTTNISPAVNPVPGERTKRPFVGFGLSRPIGP